MKALAMRAYLRHLKPVLTDAGKKQRHLGRSTISRRSLAYTKNGSTTNRSTTSSTAGTLNFEWCNAIPTAPIFLGAVARPRHSTATNTHFDGEIAIFPFTVQLRAHRNIRNNRAAGAMETRTVEDTLATYKRILVDEVIPTI